MGYLKVKVVSSPSAAFAGICVLFLLRLWFTLLNVVMGSTLRNTEADTWIADSISQVGIGTSLWNCLRPIVCLLRHCIYAEVNCWLQKFALNLWKIQIFHGDFRQLLCSSHINWSTLIGGLLGRTLCSRVVWRSRLCAPRSHDSCFNMGCTRLIELSSVEEQLLQEFLISWFD